MYSKGICSIESALANERPKVLALCQCMFMPSQLIGGIKCGDGCKFDGNYKHELSLPRLCYYCNEEDDTTEHLVSCKVMGIENLDSEHLHNENDCGLWTQVLEIVRFNMGNRKGNVPIK